MCYCKHPNSFSMFPCIFCMVEQTQDNEGGDLGDQLYDIVANRRARGLIPEGRSKLEALASDPVQQGQLSSALGVVAPREGDVWLLFEALDIVPTRVTPVESLHADALVRSQW